MWVKDNQSITCDDTNLVVCGIYENFIDDLVESRYVLDITMHHSLAFRVVCPRRLRDGLYTTDI
jgi:hypothetical protein